MRYRFAICEDNDADAQYFCACVSSWAGQKGVTIQAEIFSSAESFLFRYEEDKNYDVLLLDIEMGQTDGVTLAKQIRSTNDDVQIIFITGFPDFMAEGYEVSALHYLMTPVSEEKLSDVLDRALERLGKHEKYVLLHVDEQKMRIPVSAIICVEVFSHVCVIKTCSEQLHVKYSISELEDMFGNDLVRCHRSYLVNPKFIKSITKKEIRLDNNETVPISRSSYQAVNQKFIEYYKWE